MERYGLCGPALGRASPNAVPNGYQLGGPLDVIDDVSGAIKELRTTVHDLKAPLILALDTAPGVQSSLEVIATYMPWLIGGIGFLGMAILIRATTLPRR